MSVRRLFALAFLATAALASAEVAPDSAAASGSVAPADPSTTAIEQPTLACGSGSALGEEGSCRAKTEGGQNAEVVVETEAKEEEGPEYFPGADRRLPDEKPPEPKAPPYTISGTTLNIRGEVFHEKRTAIGPEIPAEYRDEL